MGKCLRNLDWIVFYTSKPEPYSVATKCLFFLVDILQIIKMYHIICTLIKKENKYKD